jgi:hypothetical protein
VRPITTINDSILDGKKFFFDFGGEKKPAVNVAETVMEHARGERAEGVSEKTIKETHKESHAAMVSLKKMLEEADKTGIHGDSSVSAPAAAGDEQPEDNEWQPLDPNWKPKELPGDLAGSVLNPGDPGKKGHKQSVDIVLDISLVPKMTEYDRDKYAGTLANLMKLAKKSAKGDINLVLKLPYEKNTETMPGTLLKDIDNAENAQALLTAVNKELGEGVTLESRPGAITVPIIGKSWLEWARDNGIKLEENEYPVALDGPTFIEGKGIAFRDLEAAFTIAICQASLAALKKRGVGMTAELAEARKKVIAELGDLYRTALGSDAYMEETITFLLHDDPRTRLRVAIALALPSAGRFDMRAFIDLNMFMRELVSAA